VIFQNWQPHDLVSNPLCELVEHVGGNLLNENLLSDDFVV
jgi:hypothetical protein